MTSNLSHHLKRVETYWHEEGTVKAKTDFDYI
jgi:hypothetical protein